MEALKCRTRLAVLWLIQAINFTAYIMFNIILRAAGVIPARSVEEVKATPPTLAFIFFIYLLMAWLSLTLKDKATRWTNVIVGIIFAIILALAGITGAVREGVSTGAIFFTFVFGFVVFLLTIYYAWKLPKQEA